MMNRDERDDSKLLVALRTMRRDEPDLGPSRLELERRRLMANVAELNRRKEPFQAWRTVFVGSLVGAAAVAAVALFVFFVGGVGSDFSAPEVSLAGVWQLESNDAIAKGTTVRVPKNGKATLVLDDGTMIWAGPGTVLSAAESDGSKINLESGHFMAKVQPRDNASRFEVVTSEADVQVLGTLFSVTVDNGHTTVRLHEGKVKLTSQDHTIIMQPGHRVITSDKGLLSMEVFGEPERIADLQLSELHETPTIKSSVSKIEDESTEPLIATATQDNVVDSAPLLDSEMEFQEIESHSKASAKGSVKAKTEISGKLQTVRDLWAAHKFAEIVEETDKAGLDTDLLFYRGKSLSKLGRWSMAGETFAAVAGMNPARRSEALYLSANAYNKARNFERSLDMAELTINTGGTNADHAWRLKIGALSGLGRYKAAAEAAADYLTNYPTGAHVAEALFARGTGLRLSKQWPAAARAYKRFINKEAGSTAMRDDAGFYHAYSLIRAGQPGPGKSALKQYLSIYPGGRHTEQARALLTQ